jgi:predicted AlkP superfamily phosphohydrolase/phosphomutase
MKRISRREFIKGSTGAAVALAASMSLKPSLVRAAKPVGSVGRKTIIIGFDGMDPKLCNKLMAQGALPNLDSLRRRNGFRALATSDPPQSPVAWANFINGAGPDSHGIFDFIHRDPQKQAMPFFAAATTLPAEGGIDWGNYRIPLDFWPFNHKPQRTVLTRQGIPFWHYLDQAKIESTFYDLPSNYPPSPSEYGHHRCLSGMGTPDLSGTYGTYQYFSEDGPEETVSLGGGDQSKIVFEGETSRPMSLTGPGNTFLKEPKPATISFVVHRDQAAQAAVVEIQNRVIVLKQGEWSPWIKLDYGMSMPSIIPNVDVKGICRFYLQEVAPNFRLYVTPINIDPSNPAVPITEPADFAKQISSKLGLFYTTGFQEDHKALSHGVFSDDEFVRQATAVLKERENLLHYALSNYDDGLLFFYFSSTDLQSHMLWWDSDRKHPTRSLPEAKRYFDHVKALYQHMDAIVGDLLKRYGNSAHIIVMSDHGFSNFERQFSVNSWLRDNGYLGPREATSILGDVDWSKSRAFGLGINGLYLNLKGRERFGVVEPGKEKDRLLDELVAKFEAVRDSDGRRVVEKAHRTDKQYKGPATRYAPDLILGYARDFRASWKTCLGSITEEVLLDNDSAWSADHCVDSSIVPGVLFSNRPIDAANPSLVDLAPSILTEYHLKVPSTMVGKNIFKAG